MTLKIDHRRLLCIFSVLIVLFGMLMTPRSVKAGTVINVTPGSADENGENNAVCSLREAVIAANENRSFGGCPAGSSTDADIIYLPAGTYYLTKSSGTPDNNAMWGDIDITQSVMIVGAGADQTIIDGERLLDRAFHVINAGTVTISNVTIRYAHVAGTGTGGWGGGIFNDHSNLKVSRSIFTENHASGNGGAIANSEGGFLTVTGSEIKYNTAQRNGGGIFNKGRTVVEETVFSYNQANTRGGAVDTNSAQTDYLKLINVTVAYNTAREGRGGGIFGDAPINVINSTILENQGGGLASTGSGTIKNTIISKQTSGKNCSINPQYFVSQGHNLEFGNDCGFSTSKGDKVNTDPRLTKVSRNDGTFHYFSLASDSPAIDAGDNNGCPATDLRGGYYQRWGGKACDIGAYEVDAKYIVYSVYLPATQK